MEGYEAWSSINIYAQAQKWTIPIFLTYWGHISLLTSWVEKYKVLRVPFSFFSYLFIFISVMSFRCWELPCKLHVSFSGLNFLSWFISMDLNVYTLTESNIIYTQF